MRGKSFIILAVLFLCAWPALGVTQFNDGLTHDVDYEISDKLWVDYETPNMYTTVNILDGAKIEEPSEVIGYESSRINVFGGYISKLYVVDFTQVDISGGSIRKLISIEYCQVDISGGSIDRLRCINSSQINVSGGTIRDISSDESLSVSRYLVHRKSLFRKKQVFLNQTVEACHKQ